MALAPCQLGCSEDTRVYIKDRCGASTVGDITDSVSFLKYGRELDDDSECEVSVHFESDAAGRMCCETLAKTRTWRHEIAVERDGEPVWEGPIINISYQRSIGHVVARDIVAWLDVRVIHNAYEFVGVDLSTIAQTVIEDAVGAHDDVCVLQYMSVTPAGAVRDMSVRTRQRTAGEVLRELAQSGLDFTVVGRSLVIGADFAFGPVGPLTDGHFLNDVEVEERGLAAATKWYHPGTGVVGSCGGVDPYLGLIERAVENFAESTDQAFLDEASCFRLSTSNPPPLHVNIPDGAQLSPDAPVCPRLLVPGTLVDLDISETCRPARVRQRLTAVQFRNDDKTEQVSVTIAPAGLLAEAEV